VVIILFYSGSNGDGKRLLREIESKIHGHRIEIVQTVQALSNLFRSPMIGRAIMVMMAESTEQLEELISMGDLMSDLPIFLVLPDRNPATVSIGRRLYPRFVAYVDSDFSDFVSVLSKLIHHGLFGNDQREAALYTDFQNYRTTGWTQIPSTQSDGRK